jgi:hypothetical protein
MSTRASCAKAPTCGSQTATRQNTDATVWTNLHLFGGRASAPSCQRCSLGDPSLAHFRKGELAPQVLVSRPSVFFFRDCLFARGLPSLPPRVGESLIGHSSCAVGSAPSLRERRAKSSSTLAISFCRRGS